MCRGVTQCDLSSSSDEAYQSSNGSDDLLMGVCEKAFPPSSGNNQKKLLAMCYGLADAAGHSLGVTGVYPFKETVGRVNIISNQDQLRDEILLMSRRSSYVWRSHSEAQDR
jgi:hypothetical protein